MARGAKEKGREIKCDFIGRDGYFETARIAVETAPGKEKGLGTAVALHHAQYGPDAEDETPASQDCLRLIANDPSHQGPEC